MKTESLLAKADDDTEIVIVSDTVRQRRSRTPISANLDGSRESNVVMPDLLPNSVFSGASAGETQSRGEKYSVVEVKERQLSSQIVIKTIDFEDATVDTINVFESCSALQPEQVEMVNIIDAGSDTDTATSTPLLNRRSIKSLNSTNGSMDELKVELKRELENVTTFVDEEPVDQPVKKLKTSHEKYKAMQANDRDLLRDSEIAEEKALKAMKLRPTLRELWMEERNSFYDLIDDNDIEPLEFSDDEEIPRYSVEMDSDSDVVAAFNS